MVLRGFAQQGKVTRRREPCGESSPSTLPKVFDSSGLRATGPARPERSVGVQIRFRLEDSTASATAARASLAAGLGQCLPGLGPSFEGNRRQSCLFGFGQCALARCAAQPRAIANYREQEASATEPSTVLTSRRRRRANSLPFPRIALRMADLLAGGKGMVSFVDQKVAPSLVRVGATVNRGFPRSLTQPTASSSLPRPEWRSAGDSRNTTSDRKKEVNFPSHVWRSLRAE